MRCHRIKRGGLRLTAGISYFRHAHLCFIRVAAGHSYTRASSGKATTHGGANTSVAAGHERHFVVEPKEPTDIGHGTEHSRGDAVGAMPTAS
jgi:hypothetical protein